MPIVKEFDSITYAEWLCWIWVEVTAMAEGNQTFIRARKRPVDEAARLAGSFELLKPYLWAYTREPENA